jgi:hypothetical protein
MKYVIHRATQVMFPFSNLLIDFLEIEHSFAPEVVIRAQTPS